MSPNLLEAVSDVARIAGHVAMRSFGSDVAVREKADHSLVSDADVAAERAAREWIALRFPGDAVLGEELGETAGKDGRRWIIDPIDGTTSFLLGVPLWGTLVAVAEGETVLAGAIHCPAAGQLVCAAVGEGCWLNGARTRVSDVADLSKATVLTSSVRIADVARAEGWRALAQASRVARTWGDCFGYLLVAAGRAEVMVDPVVKVWDLAAVLPVIVEAGGEFTDWGGRVTAFGGSAIATNAALAQDARALLGADRP
jgi:histidinol phosphatase-like enzyme (inositol monophosphatase family)